MYEFHIVIVQVQDSTCLFQCMNRSRLSLRFSIFLLFFLARHHLTLHALKVLKNFLRLLNSRLIWRSGNSFYKVNLKLYLLVTQPTYPHLAWALCENCPFPEGHKQRSTISNLILQRHFQLVQNTVYIYKYIHIYI